MRHFPVARRSAIYPPVGPGSQDMFDKVMKYVFPADFPPKPIRKADGPPSALRTYLDYYRKLDAPGFAVLVTGEWGVGKTYQVVHSLDADEFFHISLFGLRTAEELRSAVFAQMFPSRHRIKGLIADAKQALSAASGLFAIGSLTPSLLGALLDTNISSGRILIFDDLERSRMPLKVLLGVINNYVEHSGCRVIVIVHDKKVLDSYLNDAKEKLFGQTLEAIPQIRQAFSAFIEKYRDKPFGRFLAPYEQDILEIFEKSGQPSLRLLKYLIEDLRRFYDALEERHRQHPEVAAEAIKMMSVFAIEIRAAVMGAGDLIDRRQQAYISNDSKIVQANARYGTIRLDSTTLQDALLTKMFIQGIYNPDEIRKNLDESYHYLVPGKDPPWRIVFNFDKLDDEEVTLAVRRMNEQIETFEELVPGEMLHILALRLMMAEEGISGRLPDDVVEEAKAYIDGMLERGRIPPRSLSHEWTHERYSAYDGIGFWVSGAMTGHFKRIVDHLRQAQEAALDRKLLEEAPDLLQALDNGEKFYEQLVSTYKGNNPYAHVPILDAIDPRAFVDAWLAAPKKGWYWIENAIDERYKATFHTDALRRERPWIRQVVGLLKAEVEQLQGFSKFRLSRAIPRSVRSAEEHDVVEQGVTTVGTPTTQESNEAVVTGISAALNDEPKTGQTRRRRPTKPRKSVERDDRDS